MTFLCLMMNKCIREIGQKCAALIAFFLLQFSCSSSLKFAEKTGGCSHYTESEVRLIFRHEKKIDCFFHWQFCISWTLVSRQWKSITWSDIAFKVPYPSLECFQGKKKHSASLPSFVKICTHSRSCHWCPPFPLYTVNSTIQWVIYLGILILSMISELKFPEASHWLQVEGN